jgi:hypothetical protein
MPTIDRKAGLGGGGREFAEASLPHKTEGPAKID